MKDALPEVRGAWKESWKPFIINALQTNVGARVPQALRYRWIIDELVFKDNPDRVLTCADPRIECSFNGAQRVCLNGLLIGLDRLSLKAFLAAHRETFEGYVVEANCHCLLYGGSNGDGAHGARTQKLKQHKAKLFESLDANERWTVIDDTQPLMARCLLVDATGRLHPPPANGRWPECVVTHAPSFALPTGYVKREIRELMRFSFRQGLGEFFTKEAPFFAFGFAPDADKQLELSCTMVTALKELEAAEPHVYTDKVELATFVV